MYFLGLSEEMTIGVNCGPEAYSKLLKAEARFGETQQNFDIRRRPGKRWLLGGMPRGDERPPATSGLEPQCLENDKNTHFLT